MRRKTVFIDGRAKSEILSRLRAYGFEVVALPRFSHLSDAVASHTDMLLFKVGGAVFSHADYVSEAPCVFDALHESGIEKIHLTDDNVRSEYPFDAVLNILVFGKRVFCKRDTASEYVINYLEKNGYKIINVRQGYPACTVLKLSDTAAITADKGMAKVLEKEKIKVTLIENGGIELAPYEYGFIGGAAGISDGKIYFTGSLDAHPSVSDMLQALENAGLTPVYLTRTLPVDVGGLLFTD